MKKFKLIFLLFLSLILIFGTTSFGATFNGEELADTSSVNDNYYGIQTVKNIMDDLNITYDENDLPAYTYYTNKALQNFQQTYSDIKVINACFYNTSNTLRMIVSNGSFSNSIKYIYVNAPGKQIRFFDSWSYGGANNDTINGVNSSICTYIQINKDSISKITNSINIGTCEFSGDMVKVSNLLSPIATYAVAAQNYNYKFNWYFLGNTIRFSKTSTPDAGESGDTSSGDTGTDSGDFGGSNQNISLEMTNQKIDQLNKHAEQILATMPTSGDIKEATTQGTVQGNKDYWGNNEDLNGENQEELIEGKVDELIETVSGDLNKNEIFNILETYEKKLFGSFTGQQDFKISWNDIKYMGATLIPKGEINFSEICRENETLGKVKTTVNIILGFLLLLNCIKYLYNLLLATLGIDNPYLYEKPEDTTSVTYYTNTKTGKTYENTTMKRKDGKTFKYRREL